MYCSLLYLPIGERYESHKLSSLCLSLKSPIFHYSVGISIGVCVPLFISCFLDSLQPHGIGSKTFFLIRLLPLSSFLVFESLIGMDSLSCADPTEYWRLTYMQAIVLLTSAYPFLHLKCPEIWTTNKISVSLGLISLSCVFRFHDNHILYFGSSLGILSFACLLVSIIFLMIQYYKWYVKFSLGKAVYKDFNDDTFLCWAYMNTLLITQIIWLISLLFFININAFDMDIAEITLMNSGITVIILVYSTFHSRRLRSKILQTQVSLSSVP